MRWTHQPKRERSGRTRLGRRSKEVEAEDEEDEDVDKAEERRTIVEAKVDEMKKDELLAAVAV